MITDFNLAPAVNNGTGDVLDLHELLVGVGPNPTLESLDQYLSFGQDTATGKTVITIDLDATPGGAVQTITLDNVPFSNLVSYVGVTSPSDQDIISKLLAEGNLKVTE